VDRSKQAVLSAARELIAEKGVSAMSIDGIAERSGVAKTTIYRHWAGKPQIVLDVIAAIQGPISLPDTGSLQGDLDVVARGLARALSQSEWSSILPSLIEAAERDDDLARLHRTYADNRHRVLAQILERARKRGELRDDLADDDILELIAGPLFYRRLITGEPIPDSRAKDLVRMIVSLASPDG
jgi:AcrR family transcriptional regulator